MSTNVKTCSELSRHHRFVNPEVDAKCFAASTKAMPWMYARRILNEKSDVLALMSRWIRNRRWFERWNGCKKRRGLDSWRSLLGVARCRCFCFESCPFYSVCSCIRCFSWKAVRFYHIQGSYKWPAGFYQLKVDMLPTSRCRAICITLGRSYIWHPVAMRRFFTAWSVGKGASRNAIIATCSWGLELVTLASGQTRR